MSMEDYFWKAFEATGSPQLYLLYRKKQNTFGYERDKRNAGL